MCGGNAKTGFEIRLSEVLNPDNKSREISGTYETS
jgi:hypothetical protein